MFPRKRLLTLVLALWAGNRPLPAQVPDAAPPEAAVTGRPRVGLVLSGGGARGAAHIGVLRVLEEYNVPIDAIAGTSMGSIIGGLYAAGLSPDEIEEAITSVSWGRAFSDNPGRERSSFRRKRDDRDFLIKLELGLKAGGFSYSRGIIQGQNLGLLMKHLAASAELIEDFDDLPIPYRAVATDALTGEAVVIDSGGLAGAMRASMSVPGVFEPMEVDGRLLIDGGMSAQTPISVVRRMGVDVVIVVDLTIEDDLQASKIGTPFTLLSELLLMVVTRNAQVELGTLTQQDILIQPDMEGYSSADFAGAVAMIEPGAFAARRLAWRLEEFSIPHDEFEQHIEQIRVQHDSLVHVDRILIENGSKLADEILLERLGIQPGSKIDLLELREGLDRIYGLGYFESVTYNLERRGGESVVIIKAKRKAWGPNYVRFGLQLRSDFRGENEFNFGGRVVATEMNASGGEWITDVQIGVESLLRTSFYQPLDRGLNWFVEPALEYSRSGVAFYDGESRRVADYQVESSSAVLQGGYTFGNWGELRTGVEFGEGKGHLRTGDPSFPSGDFGIGNGFFSFESDTLDNWVFPSDGEYARARVQLQREDLGSDQDIDVLELTGSSVHTREAYTTTLWGRLGVADTTPQVQNLHRVGGLFNLSGLAENQLFGRTAGMVGAGARKRFGDLEAALQNATYIGMTLEFGGAWLDGQSVSVDSTVLAGSLYVAMDSPIGPFYLAWGHAEGGHDRLYLNLGRAIHSRI